MSYFFPYEHFYIETELKPEEVQHRLENAIRPYKPVLASWGGKRDKTHLFEGIVTADYFSLRSDTYTKNEMLIPIANGTVKYEKGSSQINIKIKPARKIWIPYAFGAILATMLAIGHAPIGFGIFFTLAILSYPFVMLIFKYETSGIRSALCKLLDGEIHFL